MAPSAAAHHRSHSLLLLQKLLNLRDKASPLTLILDTLEQSAQPVLNEFMTRAKISKTKIIFISLSTHKKPPLANVFIRGRHKTLQQLAAEIIPHVTPSPSSPNQKNLLLITPLHPLLSHPHLLPTFLQSIIPPSTSCLLVYHLDIPLLLSPSPSYSPTPLQILTHLSTSILTLSSLPQTLASKAAADKSLPSPTFGLNSGREGVLVGLHHPPSPSQSSQKDGVVITMELRRKSGRVVQEKFVLFPSSSSSEPQIKSVGALMLLSDHPAFSTVGNDEQEEDMEATFNLGLTEKQRRDREGVVLPYFDAQTEVGGGEGGRILYDMGREDDFDEEEDEI
ncbi:Elongator complex protein 5 [Triangularia verruculosa]|uniref:Elongator complex protein 5 n=1 Tax=Triangularia verruculosa TaxID=2587418 RepID=A0AAN6XQ76_9PEZI|nr:Elongator complex protein 5 [Triangularia verruculosa]